MLTNFQFPQNLKAYALVGGAIFDAHTGELRHDTALQIEGNRIVAIGSPANLPENIKKFPLNGRTILPGLIDVHVHSEDWHAPLFLAKGITTVRDVGCALESVLARRLRWNAKDAIAPRLVCTGPLLDGPGNTWPATTTIVNSPEDARAQVDYLVERGVDQIKTYAFIDRACFEAIVDQAHRHGKFVVSHLGKHVDARQAIEAGVDEIEHLSGVSEAMWWEHNQAGKTWDWVKLWATIDAGRMAQLVDLILETGTWMAITRMVWLRLATAWDSRHQSHPQMAYLPQPLRAYWETRFPKNVEKMEVPKTMQVPSRLDRSQQVAGMSIFTTELIRKGAKILVGTDTPFPFLLPGFSYHDELQALLDCGMGHSAVLRAATLSAARALEIDHLTGSLDAGKLADLIIVNGDPTEDIQALQQIEAVVRDGRWHNPEELLAQAAGYAQQPAETRQKRFDAIY